MSKEFDKMSPLDILQELLSPIDKTSVGYENNMGENQYEEEPAELKTFTLQGSPENKLNVQSCPFFGSRPYCNPSPGGHRRKSIDEIVKGQVLYRC